MNPNYYTLISFSYVHLTFSHFIFNIVTYFFIIFFIFYFDSKRSVKYLFINLILLFIALPFLYSSSSMIMFNYFGENVIDYGFSTIVAGLIGYLPISYLGYLKKVELVNLENKYTILLLIFTANLALISLINNWHLLVVPLTLFFIVSIAIAKKDIKRMFTLFCILSHEKKIGTLYICLISFMLCFFLSLSLFPASIKNTEGFTNVFAHYIGYIFGFAIPDLFSNKL